MSLVQVNICLQQKDKNVTINLIRQKIKEFGMQKYMEEA